MGYLEELRQRSLDIWNRKAAGEGVNAIAQRYQIGRERVYVILRKEARIRKKRHFPNYYQSAVDVPDQ
jgi:Mor family transcriptional regulator